MNMFNFKFQQRAFEELNAEQFRVVYLLNSTLSMVNKTNKTPKNNKIEMFNGYLMDKLGLSLRMVQYHIKALEEKGFIKVKRPIGRNAAKQPNIITLIFKENEMENNEKNVAINVAINDAIDCTLNNGEINKNKINKTKASIDNVTIDTLQVYSDTPNDDWIDSFDDEEWVKYEVKRSNDYIIQSDDVNNINSDELDNISSGVMSCDSANNNLKKENEMSDNGTNGMNVMSECNERQARENESSESEKKNITSTQVEEEFDELFGLKDITSKGEHNVPVQTPKDIFSTPDPLPLFRRIDNILKEALDITEVEPFKAKLKEALQLMEQIKPINKNAFTRCCNDTICWFNNNNWNDLDMFFVASNFKRDVERMKKIVA